MAELIGSGAEAVLYLDGHVIKDRVKKDYRITEIDSTLRRSRTRREAKVLETLGKAGFPCPKLIGNDNESIVEMEFIDGQKVRDVLEASDFSSISLEIGKRVAEMHNLGLIHGDLTTSNMIVREKVFFIDFGLSFFSVKFEDKAVDLHLLRQALESKHHTIWKECFDAVVKGYQAEAKDSDLTLKRLEVVEGRGRNKGK